MADAYLAAWCGPAALPVQLLEVGIAAVVAFMLSLASLLKYHRWYRHDRNRFFPEYWQRALRARWLAVLGAVAVFVAWAAWNWWSLLAR